MSEILVTGGTGLVGAHLLYGLVKNGHHPIAIKRESSNIDAVKKVFSYYFTEYIIISFFANSTDSKCRGFCK